MKKLFIGIFFLLSVLLLCEDRVDAQFVEDQIFMIGGHDKTSTMTDSWLFGPGTQVWTRTLSPSSIWPGVKYSSCAYFQNKIWMLGGGLGDFMVQNEIWNFDSQKWTLVGNAPWSARSKAVALVFHGQLWIMGGASSGSWSGFNDVWSFDGVTWIRHGDAPWGPRWGFKGVVYQNKLWVMGGRSSSQVYNDVWSFDGTSWTQHANAPWTARYEFNLALLNNSIWLMGGDQMNLDPNYSKANDVWSFNGISWTRRADAPWARREEFGVAVSRNKIWLTGGFGNTGYFNDVWRFDGTTWTQIPDAPWSRRDGMSVVTTSHQIDISVSKTVGYEVKSADPTYTIELTNLGPDAAHNVVGKDFLPSGVAYLQHTFSSSTGVLSGATYYPSTGNISIPKIDPGEIITLKITVKITGFSQTITNTAQFVAAQEQDINSSNNSASATFTSPPPPPESAPPVIINDLKDAMVKLNQSVGFVVYAEGTSVLNYEWRHSGTIMPSKNAPYLIIQYATWADAGSYQVTVKNAFGSAISRTANLMVSPY